MIDEGGISIWSGYKPHQHNLKWLAESECVGIWKTKIRTLILGAVKIYAQNYLQARLSEVSRQ